MTESISSRDSASLLARAKAGDLQAFAHLCEPCRASTCAFLVRAGLANETDAEDVFQDAALRAMRSIGSFAGSASFSTWMVTIARNIALDRIRSQAARQTESLDEIFHPETSDRAPSNPTISPDSSFPNPAQPQKPGSALEEEDRATIVRKALLSLPETLRTALVLFYWQQMPYSEMAKVLDVPIGTVMSRLHNGKIQLEKRLSLHREELQPK